MVFRFFEKVEKLMENGGQKVMKIHEKSTLGRPWVDFLSSGVDFGRGRKIKDFWIAPRAAKNRLKSVLGVPGGRKGRSE